MKKLLLFMFLISAVFANSQATLVKNINTSATLSTSDSNPSNFLVNNGVLFFTASDYPSNVNNELWKSDGTTAGTVLVKDLRAGNSSYPNSLFVHNGDLYFKAQTSATANSLFKSDGTNPGTIAIGTTFSSTKPSFVSINGNLIYSRYDVSTNKLFSYDGTNETLLTTFVTNYDVLYTTYFGSINKVLFQATNPGFQQVLWATDGTPSGTSILKEVYLPKYFIEYNGMIYFTATDAGNDTELWSTDGTEVGTNLFLNLNSSGNSNPDNFTLFNNKLYFTADDGSNGVELWMTDGTPGGTVMVMDLNSGAPGSNPGNLIVYNNALYFTANHSSLGREIFKCNTSNTITNLKNINSGVADSNPASLIIYNNELFFTADDGVNGRELWHSTGFSTTTNMIADIAVGAVGSNPTNLTLFNNAIYFSANDNVSGIELWKYIDPALAANDFQLEANEIKLYPNPAKSHFELATSANVEKVEVYSVQGQLVKAFAYQNQYEINDLAKGMYIVKINAQEGIANKTLVIE